jgi:hypothetical protein
MSSSTFSFRAELKVIALVAAVLAAAEAVFPLYGSRFSSDLRQIEGLNRNLQRGCSTSDVSVVVLGNSLTVVGFDQAMIQAAPGDKFPVPTKFTFVAFHGALMPEFYRIYLHYIDRVSPPPKILVMPFSHHSLADQGDVRIERMVYHCDLTDVHDVIKNEVGLAQLGEFLHCYLSTAFANRFRVRQFVFERLLPAYQESEIRIRTANLPPAVSTADRAFTFTRLGQVIDRCDSRGTRVVLLAMPLQDSYDIPAQISLSAAANRLDILDMRHTPGLDNSRYTDATHLNAKGAKIFSNAFMNRFAQYLDTRYLPSRKTAEP